MDKVIVLTDEYVIHLYMSRIQRFFNVSCRNSIRFSAEESGQLGFGDSENKKNIHLTFQGSEVLYVDSGEDTEVLNAHLPATVKKELKKHFPEYFISSDEIPDSIDISLLPSVENVCILTNSSDA